MNYRLTNTGEEILNGDTSAREDSVPILGLYKSAGHIVVYGDSNCLDSNHLELGEIDILKLCSKHNFYSYNYFFIDCYWMLDAIIEYISTNKLPHVFLEDNVKISNNTTIYSTERPKNNEMHKLDYKMIFALGKY